MYIIRHLFVCFYYNNYCYSTTNNNNNYNNNIIPLNNPNRRSYMVTYALIIKTFFTTINFVNNFFLNLHFGSLIHKTQLSTGCPKMLTNIVQDCLMHMVCLSK